MESVSLLEIEDCNILPVSILLSLGHIMPWANSIHDIPISRRPWMHDVRLMRTFQRRGTFDFPLALHITCKTTDPIGHFACP